MRHFVFALLCLAVTACTQVGSAPDLQQPNYEKYGVTRLDVKEIQIVNDYIPPMHEPNVEHQFFTPPYSVVRNWAQSRFQAVGNIGVARIIIKNASVVKKDMASNADGVTSLFSDGINAQYDMLVTVRLEITSPRYDNTPFAAVNVRRSIQTRDSDTLSARDTAWNDMNLSMVDELNGLMTKSIQATLSGVVR